MDWPPLPELVSESSFTPWGKGWHAWNPWAAEAEFVDWVGALVRLARPGVVVETGVGNGYTTRTILASLPDGAVLHGFETDPDRRAAIPNVPRLEVSPDRTPSDELIATADLVVLDSDLEHRFAELAAFARSAKPRALLVVHDVADRGAGPVQARLLAAVQDLEAQGILGGALLPNPRGAYLGSRT